MRYGYAAQCKECKELGVFKLRLDLVRKSAAMARCQECGHEYGRTHEVVVVKAIDDAVKLKIG